VKRLRVKGLREGFDMVILNMFFLLKKRFSLIILNIDFTTKVAKGLH